MSTRNRSPRPSPGPRPSPRAAPYLPPGASAPEGATAGEPLAAPGGSLPGWPRRASLLWRSRCPLLPCLPPSPAAEAASIAAGEGGRPRAAEAVVSIPDSVRGCEGVWGLGPAAGTSSQDGDQGRSSHLGAGSLLKSSSNYSSPKDAPATLPKVTCPRCC